MEVSITDSQSTIESPIFIDDFEGIERAKELLEEAMNKMKDLLESLIRAKEKKTGFAALNSDLAMVLISIWSLSLCHLALDEEEDDSDEEASDPDSDDYGDEHMECEDPDTGSTSDSLCSMLATSEFRSRLESNRGIKRAKLVLEQVLCTMMRGCTRILERETRTRTVGHIPWFIPLGCICILLICYQGLDSEDDSDEEASEINPDESRDAATEDESEELESVEQEEQKQPSENQLSEHIATDADSESDSLPSIALSQTDTRNKRKKCRDEEPCLVKRTKGENRGT